MRQEVGFAAIFANVVLHLKSTLAKRSQKSFEPDMCRVQGCCCVGLL
jgi:hypothetical protein